MLRADDEQTEQAKPEDGAFKWKGVTGPALEAHWEALASYH